MTAEPPDSGRRRNGQERCHGPRRQQVEAEHRSALARAFHYRQSQATSHDELEALETAYAAALNRGPDFTHYRGKSRFTPPVPHGLSMIEIAKLRYAFNSAANKLWHAREKGKGGAISRVCADVFNALLKLAEQYDCLFPSQERLASMARCCRRSVVTALADIERLGFLTRHRRLKMVDGLMGRKAEQDTNSYEVHLPRTGLAAMLFAFFKPESECKNRAATATECLSYLRAHPDTWGSPSPSYSFDQQSAAYGGG